MKYYKAILKKGCFNRKYLEELTGSAAAAGSLVYDYLHGGAIKRVRRDLYVAIDFIDDQPVASRYEIASNIADGAYVTHHSAIEYNGFQNQSGYIVYVASKQYFPVFSFYGVEYIHVKPKIDEGVVSKNGVRITDMERTVLDCINEPNKSGGLEELMRSIDLIPSLSESKLLHYLGLYGKIFLYQKTGFILEQFKDSLALSQNFFDVCKSKLTGSRRYLNDEARGAARYNATWRLFTPDKETVFSQGSDLNADV